MPAAAQDMTAIVIAGKGGGPEVLQPTTVAVPDVGPGQMLVKVVAAGANRPDVLQRQGLYPPPKGASNIPGLEIAGDVAAVGDGVTRYREGDRVMALVNGGGYAEFAIVEEVQAIPVPAALSVEEAAGVPETFFTVWHNVFERGQLQAGEWLLVHGGTSGIGVTAIQLAKAFGARVIATAGSAGKCEACRKLGADVAIDYTAEDFVEVARAATGGKGPELILDMVGGDYIDRDIRCVAEDGRIVSIAFQRGAQVTADLQRAMLKRVTWTGSTLRARTREVKGQIARNVETKVLPLLISGQVKVLIDSRFKLTEAEQAHRRMESSAHIGKIILTVGS